MKIKKIYRVIRWQSGLIEEGPDPIFSGNSDLNCGDNSVLLGTGHIPVTCGNSHKNCGDINIFLSFSETPPVYRKIHGEDAGKIGVKDLFKTN